MVQQSLERNSAPVDSHLTVGFSQKHLPQKLDKNDSVLKSPQRLKQMSEMASMKDRLSMYTNVTQHTRRSSRVTDDLAVTAKELFGALNTQDISILDEIKRVYDCLVDLDWQVTKAKHIISKYKDLVVKMQL